MSLIESQTNLVSMTKGMLYDVRSNRFLYPECTGIIMGIQVPLMIIDRSLLSVMTGVFSDRRVTHLRARCRWRPFRNYQSYRRIKEAIPEKFCVDPKDVQSEPKGVLDHREMK